jgi:glucose-1-phosphate cytidylyltransferase
MKTVILCGGRGTRLDEMGKAVPKALVPIGGKPVIWHLLSIYAHQGFDDFVLCLGFLQDKIADYFLTIGHPGRSSDEIEIEDEGLKCRVVLRDTGLDTNTGGRLNAVRSSLADEQSFCLTYGDGLADIDLRALVEFHGSHGKTATLTAVHPVSNFGLLDIGDDASVREFREKPKLESWINGGFFVFENSVFDIIENDSVLEREPLSKLARSGELMAFKHPGFWKCMDTYKDNLEFNDLWSGNAPWKLW